MKLSGFFTYFFAASFCIAQAKSGISFPEGFNIKDFKSFSGKTLYGHINGGAELFLEYGFEKLNYYLVSSQDKEYSIDIYHMKDALAAYGIFSIKRFRCLNDSNQNPYMCQTPYQLSLLRADYFITIANDLGTQEAMSESLALSKCIIDSMHVTCANVPDFADIFQFEAPSFTLYFKGPLGFQNGLPGWEEFFKGSDGFECFYQQGMSEGRTVEMLQIRFSTETELRQFMELKGWKVSNGYLNPEKTEYIRQTGNRLAFAKGKIKIL